MSVPANSHKSSPAEDELIRLRLSLDRATDVIAAQSQRLKNIDALAATIAHDLSNILGPIILAFGVLNRRLKDPRDQDLLAMVSETAHSGSDIVKQILSLVSTPKTTAVAPHTIKSTVGGKPAPARLGKPRGNGQLILVIDDEASLRTMTARTLEAFGYRALTAIDGPDGIAQYKLHAEEIALVITDIVMPVMDGWATIRLLREFDPNVKVIASSGRRANLAEVESEQFLIKPYTVECLLHTLHEIFSPGPSPHN